jgi:hypothetical protein
VGMRELFLENFAGDLEYHPRRAAIYLILAASSVCFWAFSPTTSKFTPVPLIFVLGGLTLLIKGIFLLRPSSEGIGLSDSELTELTTSAQRKKFPSIPSQAAQIVQDFGAGGLLLWPLLNMGKDIDQSWSNPPRWAVFGVGAFLFCFGWLIRRLTRDQGPQG